MKCSVPGSDFVFNLLNANHSGYKQTGCDRSDWHHNRVCNKIKEIQKLHADQFYKCQWTIAKRGKSSKAQHDHAD